MQNRRKFLSGTLGAGFGLAATPLALPLVLAGLVSPAQARYKSPRGFHHQDWFMPLTFDLRKDLKAANESGKMLVLLWEQLGCTYCKQMHEIAFQYEEITDIAKANFHMIQMDMRGKRDFIDLAGKKMTEAELARSTQITFTPTTQFLDAAGKEVFRMPGYANPPVFKAVYEYVVEGGYKKLSFRDWVKEKTGG